MPDRAAVWESPASAASLLRVLRLLIEQREAFGVGLGAEVADVDIGRAGARVPHPRLDDTGLHAGGKPDAHGGVPQGVDRAPLACLAPVQSVEESGTLQSAPAPPTSAAP